jgi:hypothetical protein
MNERGTGRQRRATVDDPYAKPWVARDAASNVVRYAQSSGLSPADLIDHQIGIHRPDYAAVVGKLVDAEPEREIAPDEIGVSGFAKAGEVFPLSEVWRQVTGEEMPPYQPRLVSETPRRRRKGGA